MKPDDNRSSYRDGNIGLPWILRAAHVVLDFVYVALMLVLLLVAIYIKMDSESVYGAADPKRWVQYKPDFPDDVISFEELQGLNPDVTGWLTIYGTNIDYPIAFRENDNWYYLSHNTLGDAESSGAIYLDGQNSPRFMDFNNILHGHHMAKHEMFGDLDRFAEKVFFDNHEYGNIFYNGRDHGIQIIATILTDGYDGDIYHVVPDNKEEKQRYIRAIYEKAKLIRGVDLSNREDTEQIREKLIEREKSPLTNKDKLFVFSTCNLSQTNGRYIIVAKELDHPIDNPFPKTELTKNDNGTIDAYTLMNRYGSLPLWMWFFLLILMIILTYVLYRISRNRDEKLGGIAHDT